MQNHHTYNYLIDYLNEVQSKGRYSITLDELQGKFQVSKKALLQNIYRLKSKNRIAQIRQEFYAIIPPQYSHQGILPPTLFIDDLMKSLNKEYYVALFSAAALHGAAHQQPMEFQVITKPNALRNISNPKLVVRFYTKTEWNKENISKKKTDAGFINVSSPELTGFDLIYYHKAIGGINRMLPVLEELSEEMKPDHIQKVAKEQKTATIQRLGYVLKEIGMDSLAEAISQELKNRIGYKKIPLSLMHKKKTGPVDQRWKIIMNNKLEY